MAVNNTAATLSGFFKDVFAPELIWANPRMNVFCEDIPHIGLSGRPGQFHSQPVVLQHEHGFTAEAPGAGGSTLDPAVAGASKEARIEGYNVTLRSGMTFEAAGKAANGGVQAFKRGTAYLVEAMTRSMKKRMEIDLVNGQIDIGVIESVPTSTSFVITPASFAPGIWSGMEGAKIEIFDSDLILQEGGAGAAAVVTAVDLETRTITIDADPDSMDVGDRIQWKTWVTPTPVFNGPIGIHKVLANATTLYNIDAAAFSLWKSNTVDAAGPISFDVLQKAQAVCVAKGCEDDTNVYLNPKGWRDLIGDLASLRDYNKDDGNATYTLGASAIVFYGQVGRMRIKPSIFVKEGFAYMIAPKLWKRVGTHDATFTPPGVDETQIFERLEGSNVFQVRSIANWTAFTPLPGQATLITGIVNNN